MLSVLRLVPVPVLAVSLVAASVATSQDEKKQAKKKPSGPTVSLETVYLSEPVGRAHRIIVHGELGGEGQLTLDGNTCTTTQFGDRGVCTEVAFPPLAVKITQLRLADPTGMGRRIYQLKGERLEKSTRYYLIIPRRRSAAHRLVVDLGNDHRRVITLENTPTARRIVPVLGSNAMYRAEQSGGQVTLFAKGNHPTAGWQTAIEQLPISIFPPQFRLVFLEPTGAAAQVVTPFEVTTTFKADQIVTKVTIHDASGQHRVPVSEIEKKRP